MKRLAAALLACRAASADPLVLRGDALATTSAPAGNSLTFGSITPPKP